MSTSKVLDTGITEKTVYAYDASGNMTYESKETIKSADGVMEECKMENIFKVVFSGTIEQLSRLIESGENINTQDKDKRTPLIHAAINNKIDILRILVKNGADINTQDSLGYTALHYAAQNYLIDVSKLLLENKTAVDIQDIHGNTPLFRAVFNSKGRGEVISLLLSFGADMNLINKHGVSPLQLANTIGNFSVTQFMK